MVSIEKGKVIYMRIAVCVNAEDITASLEDVHLVKVYERKEEQWVSLEEFPCSLELTNGKQTTLIPMRQTVIHFYFLIPFMRMNSRKLI
ncbi:MAG: hypothetical protein K0S47_4780 [Herbinix sp.]|nr:hypothetical protein [Herbinix sp.]